MTPTPFSAEHLADKLASDLIGSFETLATYLGLRLGLYEALRDGGEQSPPELAKRAGVDERYAREWLEQQAVCGVLEVAAHADEPDLRVYRLPKEHAEVLLDELSPAFAGPVAYALGSISGVLPELLEAYRTGAGVPYEAYGQDVRDHIEQANRPMFANDLARWIEAVPALDERLLSRPGARVADMACGAGWSSISLARAYPLVDVVGFDLDEDSIERARRHVAEAGVGDRVHFMVGDAAEPHLEGTFDAVMIFEALHDMARPVDALAAAKRLLVPGGMVMIGDEKVAESFEAPSDQIERLNYGFSLLHCLPASRTETPSAATGTVMRPATVRAYAQEAGFTSFEVLGIEHDLWRFYALRP